MNTQQIADFFRERDRLAVHLGIELLEVSEGRSVARMKITDCHLNGVDVGHGGAIFTLADLAFAACSNSHGTVAVAVNISISYLRPAREGDLLTATAEEVSMSPKISTCLITVTNQAGDKVALFQGMAYRKKDPLESVIA